MLIGGDDLSNDIITLGTWFFNVCSHSHSFSLRADWRKSDSSVDGEPQGNWKRNLTLQALLPYRPAAREPLRACSQWKRNLTLQALLPYRPAAREPLRACSQTSRGGGGGGRSWSRIPAPFLRQSHIPHICHLHPVPRFERIPLSG